MIKKPTLADIYICSEILEQIPLSFLVKNKYLGKEIYKLICQIASSISFKGNLETVIKGCLLIFMMISLDPLAGVH